MTENASANHHADASERLTREQKMSPQLSHQTLTGLLMGMCAIPVVTILVLWQYLPPVFEGKLEANVFAEGLPSREFYEVEYYKRPEFVGGFLVLQNLSQQDWTHLNIQINGNYQIYDIEPIKAQSEKRYQLDRFLNRTGARFSTQYNELQRVRIYARRETKDRATFYQEFDTVNPMPTDWWPSLVLIAAFVVLFVLAIKLFARLKAASAIESAV